jgi:zinc protease
MKPASILETFCKFRGPLGVRELAPAFPATADDAYVATSAPKQTLKEAAASRRTPRGALRGVGAALVLAALPAAAQAPGAAQQAKPSEVVRLNRAPVNKDVLKVRLRKPLEASLSNGATVLILEDHRLPVVSVQIQLSGAGPLYEPADLPGLASVTATMLREGTKTRTSPQIAQEIDQLGATVNAGAGFGSAATGLFASGLSDNFEEWFALAVDLLLNPTFPEKELVTLKGRLMAQLRQQRASPGFLASERFNKAVFGSHPASVRSMTAASISAMTSENLAAWHRERYAPQNAIIAIAGDVDAKTLVSKLEKWLAAWKRTDLKEVLPPNPAPPAERRIYIVDRPGSVQTDIVMGNLSIDRRDPDYFAVYVADQIFGASASSRLFLNLRENKGYTYGVYSSVNPVKYPAPWQFGGQVRNEVTAGAMEEFVKEANRLRDELVPADELQDKQRAIVARFALSLESPTAQLSNAVIRTIYGFPADYWDTYPEKIMAVTPEQIQAVARKYINPANIQCVAVGDAKAILPVLEKYGPVEVFDTEGRPKPGGK